MAVLSQAELNQQAELSYVRGTYEVALTFSLSGYTSAVTAANIAADEVAVGTAGYARLTFNYTNADLLAYNNGQPLAQKVASFVHNGAAADIVFTHVAILRDVSGTKTVVAVESVGSVATLSSGKTAVININLLHGRP